MSSASVHFLVSGVSAFMFVSKQAATSVHFSVSVVSAFIVIVNHSSVSLVGDQCTKAVAVLPPQLCSGRDVYQVCTKHLLRL